MKDIIKPPLLKNILPLPVSPVASSGSLRDWSLIKVSKSNISGFFLKKSVFTMKEDWGGGGDSANAHLV